MQTVKENSQGMHLYELSQGSRQAKFAYLNLEKGETITPFCKCKDYFNDMFWSNKEKKKVDICGFKWSPENYKEIVEAKELSLAIKIYTSGKNETLDKTHVINLKRFINTFEKELGFKPSRLTLTKDNQYIILTYDRQWSDIPYVNGAFFLLLRAGLTYDGKEDIESFLFSTKTKFISPYDVSYIKQAGQILRDLLKGKIDKTQKYSDYTASDIHHASGPVGYFQKYKFK